MLALVNLSMEYWNLVRLVIALLQPLLVLAFIVGLVVATAHLLTMIGTRWGDRRASSKAMFFSVVIHLLLAMGLVTLIPEYRSNLISQLAELETVPIRIAAPDAFSEENVDENAEGTGGSTALFQAMPRPQETLIEPTRSRTEVPSAPEQMQPLQKPGDTLSMEPAPVPDRERLPDQPATLPEQEKPETKTELEQVSSDLKMDALPITARPEASTPEINRERVSPTPTMSNTVSSIVPERPSQETVPEQASSYSPDRPPPDLAAMAQPAAELTPATPVEMPEHSIPGPVPATPQAPEQVTRTAPAIPPPAAETDELIARTESRTRIPSLESLGTERSRVRPAPIPQNLPLERPDGRSPGMRDVLPLPAEQPQLSRSTDPFTRSGGPERIPSAYRLRTDEEREKAIMRFGGSQESEAAVDRSLKWMASVQNSAGFWDASEFGAGLVEVDEKGINRKNAGRDADVGVTALAVLAFLGKLNTVDQGVYSPQVNRALRWIVSQQTSKQWGEGWGSTPGYLGGNATEFEAIYCHAMATFALGEAYAMSRDNPDAQWLRAPLEQATNFILDVQNGDGGWRYIKGQREGDMSIFGWQVMALKSAEASGIQIDSDRKLRMQKFLADRRLGRAGGLAGYRLNERASAPMTAEALYCRQMLGVAHDPGATREALQMLMNNLPRRTSLNFYYWYYGTLAMHQHGGPEWDRWNIAVRDLLIAEQRLHGPLAGSWDPRDVWGGYGGRMYSTAVATLSLEVYYRYLPLYRINEE